MGIVAIKLVLRRKDRKSRSMHAVIKANRTPVVYGQCCVSTIVASVGIMMMYPTQSFGPEKIRNVLPLPRVTAVNL